VAAGDGNGSIRIDRRADGGGDAALEETIELRQRLVGAVGGREHCRGTCTTLESLARSHLLEGPA
jgi:hypothetical protein